MPEEPEPPRLELPREKPLGLGLRIWSGIAIMLYCGIFAYALYIIWLVI